MLPPRKTSLFLLLLFFLSSHIPAGPDIFENIETRLATFNHYYPQEKVYLHFDKPYYGLGDDIWFKAYLRDANALKEDTVSNLVHVELISPEKQCIATRIINIKAGGAGDFKLADTLHAGKYLVRAYTNFQRNFGNEAFFTKVFEVLGDGQACDKHMHTAGGIKANYVPASHSYPEVRFFPEGGDLVAGHLGWVAFKATDGQGKGTFIEGKVIDSEGRTATWLKAFHNGMGAFPFTPEKGKKYYAVLKEDDRWLVKKYPLPTVLDRGYSLRIDNSSPDYIIVSGKSNLPDGLAGVAITGQLRGQLFSRIEGKGNEIKVRLEKAGLPTGVAQFTLFADGEPFCERLVFVENNSATPQVGMLARKGYFQDSTFIETPANSPHTDSSFVEITLNTKKINADLSVAVTDADVVCQGPFTENIRTSLLLSSDLRGTIENPGYYFDGNSPQRKKHLDYLLMTQGWRRFSWKQLMKNEFPTRVHLPEKEGFNILGTVTGLYNNQPVKSTVTLTPLNNPLAVARVTTGEDGRFWFQGYNASSATELLFQAATNKFKRNGKARKGDKNVTITLDPVTHPTIGAYEASLFNQPPSNLQLGPYVRYHQRKQAIDRAFRLSEKTVLLDEVTIQGATPRSRRSFHNGAIYATPSPSRRLVVDSLPASYAARDVVELIQGRVAGVQVSGTAPNYTILVRGQNSIQSGNGPLLLLDNMPVDMSTLTAIPPGDVHYVDVIKGAETAIFGARGANGVVAVYTRKGGERNVMPEQPGILQVTHGGYYKAREFYSPEVNDNGLGKARPDMRTTLHWDPAVKIAATDSLTKKLYFRTAAEVASYRIALEGITDDGHPIRAVHQFNTGQFTLKTDRTGTPSGTDGLSKNERR